MSNSVVENLLAQTMPGFERIATQTKLVRWAEESQFARQAFTKNPDLSKIREITGANIPPIGHVNEHKGRRETGELPDWDCFSHPVFDRYTTG